MLEFIKIFKENEEIELQLSNIYNYSIKDNKLIKKEKAFNTSSFFNSKIENIFALVGANGSGKTSLIYDINDILNEKMSRRNILKYILVIKIEQKYVVKTNLDLELPANFKMFKQGEIDKVFARAIYHIGIDGNNIEIQNNKNIIDLSLNYKFQNNGNYQTFKEENVFNQLNLISQHSNLLNNIGIDDLNHPKEASYSLNLGFLNNTNFKYYSTSYLVYIYESDIYIDLYYELNKIIKDDDGNNFDRLVELYERKIFLCKEEELKVILELSKHLKVKTIHIQVEELFKSYSRAAKNEIKDLIASLESNNYIVTTYMMEIGIYFYEKVFIDFFATIMKDLNLYSIIHEKILNDNFLINTDRFIEQVFQTIDDLNFICKSFYNEEYIEKLGIYNEKNFYLKAYDLYFGEDIEDSEAEAEVEEYKSRIYSNFKSINKNIIISQLMFVNGEEPLKLEWENNINSFFNFIRQLVLVTIRNNIDHSGFIFDEYLLDLGVTSDPKYLLKNKDTSFSKKILKEAMSSLNEVIKIKMSQIYNNQKNSIEYFLKFMNHSTLSSRNLLTMKTSSEHLSEFFKRYGDNFDSCIYKFEWRNMSSGEFAILNLLSSINKCNLNSDKNDNLILFIDEGDLYLHPQWQKQFLYILIKALEELLQFKKVYILLTTHSPFLVSDLPKENILFLNSVKDTDYNIENTFAANINELLATKFFIQDGLIGKFAKEKVNNLYNEIINEFNFNKINYYNDAIDIIGEPLVKVELIKVLNEKVHEYQYKSIISKTLEEKDLEFDQDLLEELYIKLKMEKV